MNRKSEELAADICLLGFGDRLKSFLCQQLMEAGFERRSIKEDYEAIRNERLSSFPVVFIIYDDVRKKPADLLLLGNDQGKKLEPALIVTEVIDPLREKLYYTHGANEYMVLEEVSSSLLKRVIHKAFFQYHSQNIKQRRIPALIESEKKYRIIAENSLDIIAIFSSGLIYTYVSPSIRDLLGYEPEELLYKTPFQLFTFEDIEKLPSKPHKGHRDHDRYHYRVKHKNGSSIWFETSLKPLYDEEGNVVQVLATSKDITKRKRLSSMLAEMQHLAAVGAWEYYLDKDKIYTTEEIANIFGIAKDKHINFKEALGMFTTTSQKMIERELGQTLEYGKSWDLELSFYNTKGQIKWVRTVGRAYMMNGQVYKIGGTLQDISERINYEDLLYKKQSELKAFVENTPAAIAMFDKNMNYIVATNKWCEDYGIEDRSLKDRKHYGVIPKSSTSWIKVYERCLQGTIEKKEEDKILFSNGKVEWLKWEMRPWYNYKNEIGGIIAMSEIITSRKEAEELAFRQQKRMREIYQITSDLVGDISDRIKKVIEKATLALNMDFGVLGKISGNNYLIREYFNPHNLLNIENKLHPLDSTLCNITYTESGVVTIHDLTQSPWASHANISSVQTKSYIGVTVWKGGNKYGTLSFSAREAHKEGFTQADQDFVQLLGQWIGAAIDRRTFEKELVVAKEKAEEASNAKAQFVSTMSHEIRTPLNAVIGISHLLLDQNPKKEQINNLQTLQFSANNLLALINDILDFSKIESDKVEFEAIEFSIKEMLDRLVSMLEFKAKEKGIDLVMYQHERLPEKVKGDPIRLNQIITNLVSNAIKFTDMGGVSLAVEVLEETADTIQTKFVVTDTGIGIPKEKLEHIFNSFAQASSDTSRKYGGTGLGLAIAKKLVEIQGGDITVASESGKGSTFTVNMELKKAAVDNQSNGHILRKEKKVMNMEGMRVLLAEDNEVNQMVAIQFLKKKLIKTEVVNNGVMALEKIQSKSYDLVLMDLQMPEMDGYEAAQRIRSFADPYFKAIPIIALTASTMTEVRKKVKASGMDDYISKPFSPDTLYETLFKHLEKVKMDKNKSLDQEQEERIAFDKVMEFTFGEASFYFELLDKIKNEIDSFNVEFLVAVIDKDVEKIGFLAHRLSSSLKILGLNDLNKNIEKVRILLSASEVDDQEIETLVLQIDEQCKQAVKDMDLELEKA